MTSKEILEQIKVTPCKRCGGERKITLLTKWVLLWQISSLKRKGNSDTKIIVKMTSLMDNLCQE